MTEFKAGEYLTRNGQTAVVLGEMPNPLHNCDALVGYTLHSGAKRNNILSWCKNGKFHGIATGSEFDLVPRKKKLESWGFVYYQEGEKQTTIGDSEQSERNLRNYFANTLGLNCSEIFKYPDLEIEE